MNKSSAVSCSISPCDWKAKTKGWRGIKLSCRQGGLYGIWEEKHVEEEEEGDEREGEEEEVRGRTRK